MGLQLAIDSVAYFDFDFGNFDFGYFDFGYFGSMGLCSDLSL